MTRISFYTLGCRLNQSETAVLESSFENNGYQVVKFEEPADIVVVNTCTVTENGDADTRKIVNKINRLNPTVRIALVGCQAQVQKKKLTELPNVHFVVGNARKMDLVEIINDVGARHTQPVVITPTIPRTSFTMPLTGSDRRHTRANLKIQDGCNFFCSFCEIPYARGRARSRIFDDILLEANSLVAAGHKEIVLTGINVGTYGHEDKTILDVLTALESIAGLKRIRISSIEPTTIPWGIIEKMKVGATHELPLLCRYLHIPIQSGSDDILKLMQRKYSVQEYRTFIEKVFQTIPSICLGTDVIVGFPGETEAHFEETYALLRDLPFTYFHVFSYSERTMAKSQKFAHPIPKEIIERRSETLRDLSARKRLMYLQKFLNTEQSVLFEEEKRGFWTGVTDTYVRVKVPTPGNWHNQILPVRLKSIDRQTIIGEL